jgi:hypothetical protein
MKKKASMLSKGTGAPEFNYQRASSQESAESFERALEKDATERLNDIKFQTRTIM